MKRFCALVIVTLAILAIPAAADTFNLTANGTEQNGQVISVSATLDLKSLGGGVYLVTGATGTMVDPWGHTLAITGVVPTTSWVNPFSFDNKVTIPAAFTGTGGPFFLDSNGILFSTSNPGYDFILGINEYYTDGHYQFGDNGLNGTVIYPLGNWPYNTADVAVSITPSPTPEPGTLVLLGSGLMGIGGLVRRRLAT